jgi:hypothetical protein
MTRGDWLWGLAGHLLVILIWSPALFILLDQAPTWISSTWLKFSTNNLWRRVTLIWSGPSDDLRFAALVLAIGALWLLSRSNIGRRLAAALLILAILPVALSIILSATVAPVFIIRTMTALAGPAVILLAIGAAGFDGTGVGKVARWIMAIAAIFLIVQEGTDDTLTRIQAKPQEDWHAAVRWLMPRYRPGNIILAYPNESALPFARAARDLGAEMAMRPIPGPVPVLHPPPGSWYVSGSRGVPSLDQAHLRAIANAPAIRTAPTIWLLRGGPWAYDKGDVFLKELEATGRAQSGHFFLFPIDIIGLRRADTTR